MLVLSRKAHIVPAVTSVSIPLPRDRPLLYCTPVHILARDPNHLPHPPPAMTHATNPFSPSNAELPADCADIPMEPTSRSMPAEHDDDASQAEYETRYREQMERLQCPSCGEMLFL